ncbi:MAG: FMN-binding protein [Spirochaetia bacterium]|nr:FMN-binding protein [Spirochaetia bacterium]
MLLLNIYYSFITFEPIYNEATINNEATDNNLSINNINKSKEENTNKYVDGIYSGIGIDFRGQLILKVYIFDDIIKNIKVNYSQEDDRYFEKAFFQLKKEIFDKQNTDVDTICCATQSSKAIIDAVQDALNQAQIK